jgi:hypothetical protein
MLDLVFFGVFKRIKKHIAQNSSVPVTEDHAMRMFRACESAGASSTGRRSFICAGFDYARSGDGGYTGAFDEAKVRGLAGFREVWEIDYATSKLDPR